jgi:hypothetical protein
MRGEIITWNLGPGPSLSLLDYREPPSGFGPFARGAKDKRFLCPQRRKEPATDGFAEQTNYIVAYYTSYCQAKNLKRGWRS